MTFVGLDPDLLRIEARRFLEVAKESQSIADEYREIGRLGQMEEFTNITVKQLEEVHDELTEAANFMLRKCDEMEALFAPGGALSGGLGQPPAPLLLALTVDADDGPVDPLAKNRPSTSSQAQGILLGFKTGASGTEKTPRYGPPNPPYSVSTEGFRKALAAGDLAWATSLLRALDPKDSQNDSKSLSKEEYSTLGKELRDAVISSPKATLDDLTPDESGNLAKLIVNLDDDVKLTARDVDALNRISSSVDTNTAADFLIALGPECYVRLVSGLGQNLYNGNDPTAVEKTQKMLEQLARFATGSSNDPRMTTFFREVVGKLNVRDIGIMFLAPATWPPEVLARAAVKVLLSETADQHLGFETTYDHAYLVSPRTSVLKALEKNPKACDLYIFGAGKFDEAESWRRAQNLTTAAPGKFKAAAVGGRFFSDDPKERKVASSVLRLAISSHEGKQPHTTEESQRRGREVAALLDQAMLSTEQGGRSSTMSTTGEGKLALAYLYNTVLFDEITGAPLAAKFTSKIGLPEMEVFLGNIAENNDAYKLLMVGVANYVQATPYNVLVGNGGSPATVAGGIVAAVREKAIENNEENAARASLLFSIAFGTATAGLASAPVFADVSNWMLASGTEFAIESANEVGSRTGKKVARKTNLEPYNQVTQSLNAQFATAVFTQTDSATKNTIANFVVKDLKQKGEVDASAKFVKSGKLIPPVLGQKMANGSVATAADLQEFGSLLVQSIKSHEREAREGSEFEKATQAMTNFNTALAAATVHTKKG